ncbi:hypothetical protein EJD97_024277 [Solanum chilense]|uniref:Putative plant transposon protein domain-containing protein n=1 Tax=Solanum chilense TaxID=4083 RepID=A0A6N2C541_SOLCI|nr:hypothetical protein EJD97_024277 [Solanum chilense]
MAPKQDRVYARGRSKSVAQCARLVIGSNDERDPECVPPGTSTPSRVACASRDTPKKVASGAVTTSQSDKECTLTGTPSRSATHEEGADGSLEVLLSEEASRSAEVPAPTTAAQSASSDEADSSKSTPDSPTRALTLIADHANWWCVDRQYQVYSDAKFLNDKGVMTWTLTLEREELVREFYAFYMATLRSQIDRWAAPAKKAALEHVRVRGIQVDISLLAIRRYLYGEDVDANRTPLTAEFDYRWQIVKDGQFLREPSMRETTKRWMALHLSVDGEGADWLTEPKGAIKKANLTITAKFLWLSVRHCLSPTAADKIVTWDRAVLMAAMIDGFEVDFAWLLQAVMHERAFKFTTTYPFPCMIFSLCRSAGMPIWHIDQLKSPPGTVDIGLIKDEANELAPHRGPRPELPPLGDNLVDTVAHARTATQAASTDTTPVECISGSSTAPSSSFSAPFPALVPLARVQKLEAQMAMLLHHIHPLMQSSIAKAEERLDWRMVQHTERKIIEVHQRLDAFELRVLARPSPQVDVSTLQVAVDSLRADINMILEPRVPESEAPSLVLAADTMMAALFATSEIPPPPTREHAKRHRGREEDESRSQNKECREMEAVRRASLFDEKARRMRAVESAGGASSSRNVEIAGGTTDNVVAAEDTTEGVHITEVVDSEEPDPPAC